MSSTRQENPNILFIVIDALRARNLSCYGYPKPTSPNIDKLAKEGVLFENAFSCTTATDPSLATIFSGKYPISHGIINQGPGFWGGHIKKLNDRGVQLLPEILKFKGYTTLAVDWLGSRWHRMGYDYYSSMLSKNKDSFFLYYLASKYLSKFPRLYVAANAIINRIVDLLSKNKMMKGYDDAKTVTDYVLDLIRDNNKNFFLFIHYWDVHAPYNPPPECVSKDYHKELGNIDMEIEDILSHVSNPTHKEFIRNLAAGKRVKDVIAVYNGEITFVDHEIGRLIKTLEDYSILENTLIILTADHGESLTEHGIYFTHAGLYDETIHVPLIFRYPKFSDGLRVKGFVQHFDIAPTILDILDILGIDIKSYDFDGKSLLPLINKDVEEVHQAIYAEHEGGESRAIRTNNYKFISPTSKNAVYHAEEELYDLRTDPAEEKNIVNECPEVADRLGRQLSIWIGDCEDRKHKREKERIKSKIKGLKSLDRI